MGRSDGFTEVGVIDRNNCGGKIGKFLLNSIKYSFGFVMIFKDFFFDFLF